MPIYEFFCSSCNVIFNFYSSRINTEKIPACPRCGKEKLVRQLSTFATIGKAKEKGEDDLDMDESKMEEAFMSLMKEAEHMDENDPRQMASLMRKFSDKTGMQLGQSMEEAISRLEAGEDPEQIEKEMGDSFSEDDFSFESLKKKAATITSKPPTHDDTLYEL